MLTWIAIIAAAALVGGAIYVYWQEIKEFTQKVIQKFHNAISNIITVITYEGGKLIEKVMFWFKGQPSYEVASPTIMGWDEAFQMAKAAGLSDAEAEKFANGERNINVG